MAAQAEVGLVLRHLHGLSAETADSTSDHQLLSRFINTRDEEAFATLVRRHGGMVLGLCRRLLGGHHDAEDAFQAVFLILARKASSLRRGESVGAWLYRVAYRLALKARAASALRRDRESQGTTMPPPDPTAELTVKELHLLLDEELQQLPDKYRAPVVLCHLEGKSQQEAARQLGWSKDTLRRRLGQGRELLRRRLLRRGLAPAVALAATLTPGGAAPAAVSAEMVGATTRAALGFAAGMPPASPSVAVLAEGGMRSPLFSGMKPIMTLLLAVAIAVGTGLWACRAGAPPSSPSERCVPAPQTKKPAEAKQESADTIEVSGRVLDPTGKPVAGARLYCFLSNLMHIGNGGVLRGASRGKPTGTASGPDGRFRFHVRKSNLQVRDEAGARFEATVAAVAAGHGPAWKWVGTPEGLKDLTLKLAREDVPVRGRVVGLEGKPIKGVTVTVVGIMGNDADDLKPLVRALRQNSGAVSFWDFLHKSIDPALVGLPHTATTDADGRFLLQGFGRGRVVALRFEGPAIETQVEYAMTQPGATTQARGDRKKEGRFVLHGATFERVAAPTRPVIGAVHDGDTGKPLAGVRISGFAALNTLNTIHTTTDRDGRYRLSGLPRGGSHRVFATVPEGQPYLSAVGHTRPAPGFDPIRLDFRLKRGVLIRGRVTDGVTGKPIPARVHYFAFTENPNLNAVPSFRGSSGNGALTRPDGSFVLVGLPGRGLIAARALEADDRYIAGAGAAKIKGGRDGRFPTDPYVCYARDYHSLTELNPATNARSMTCNVLLPVGRTVTGSIVGPDGGPVTGVQIDSPAGRRSQVGPLPTDRFRLAGIDPKNPRPFFFTHEGKRLGAAVLLTGNEPGKVVIRLQQLGTVSGRLRDSDGQPLGGVRLSGVVEAGQFNLTEARVSSFLATTDKQGRFRISLIAGVKWGAEAMKGGALTEPPFRNVLLRPGEIKDLGDITIRRDP